MFQVTSVSLILFITTAINLVVILVSWRRRKTKSGLLFVLGVAGGALWTMASGFDYAAVSIPLKVFFAKWEVVGYSTSLTFFTLFVLAYRGYEKWLDRAWVRALFFSIPVSNIILAWTNELHHWVWTDFRWSEAGDNILIFEHGPGFLWLAFTGYLLIGLILVNLFLALRSGSEISRRQARLLFLAALFPVVANSIYLSRLDSMNGVDWTSITFSVTGILFLFAFSGTRFLDILPIAHEELIHGLSDGMIVLDPDNRIIEVNHVAAEMLNHDPLTLIGRNLVEIIPSIDSLLIQVPQAAIHTEFEMGGSRRHFFDVLISPLRAGNEKNIGCLMILRDITSRKENELRLLQLTQAVEQSPASVLITDVQGYIQYVNPQFSILTGFTAEEAIGQRTSIVKSGLTPDSVYRDMWQTILSGKNWRGEFLNRKKNGDLYWEQAVMAPVIDANGTIINFIAVKEEITQRKQAEDALRLSEERFRQLVMSAPDAVFGVDVDGKIVFANHEAARLLGYEEAELIDWSVDVLVPEYVRAQHMKHRNHYSAHPHTRSMGGGRELTARCKDGTEIPVEINLSHSTTEKGSLVIAHMRDITRRKRAEDALRTANQQLEGQLREIGSLQSTLREQVLRDPLTQLHNRRFLNEAIEQEFHHAQRALETLCILLLDIDHFKVINDTYGHVAGDACLVSLSKLIQKHIRKSDISCRYGGEEFMLVLPATSVEGAARYAERLRQTISREAVVMDGQEIRFTISIGISSYPLHGETHKDIINKADEALYASKRGGRNRVTVWSPEIE